MTGPATAPLPPNFSIDVPSEPDGNSHPGGHDGGEHASTDLAVLAYQPVGSGNSQSHLNPEAQIASGEPQGPGAHGAGPGLGAVVGVGEGSESLAWNSESARDALQHERSRLAAELTPMVQLGPGESDADPLEDVEEDDSPDSVEEVGVAGPDTSDARSTTRASSPVPHRPGPDAGGESHSQEPDKVSAVQALPPGDPEQTEAAAGHEGEEPADALFVTGDWRRSAAIVSIAAGTLGFVLLRRKHVVRRTGRGRVVTQREATRLGARDDRDRDESPRDLPALGSAEANSLRLCEGNEPHDRTTAIRPIGRDDSAEMTTKIRAAAPEPVGGRA